MMAKAIALLTAYGETLDNKDHGANRIHKLLIEGRLAVTLLPNMVQEGGLANMTMNPCYRTEGPP